MIPFQESCSLYLLLSFLPSFTHHESLKHLLEHKPFLDAEEVENQISVFPQLEIFLLRLGKDTISKARITASRNQPSTYSAVEQAATWHYLQVRAPCERGKWCSRALGKGTVMAWGEAGLRGRSWWVESHPHGPKGSESVLETHPREGVTSRSWYYGSRRGE